MVEYIPISEQLAIILIKALGRTKFEEKNNDLIKKTLNEVLNFA
jgi:hypothetical protein